MWLGGEKSTGRTQKAILVYENGREDLILQASCEGQDFGWLIAVPSAPEVKQGSLKCFFDLSRFTQEPLWPGEFDFHSLLSSRWNANRIRPIEIQTIGQYDVKIIAPQDKDWFSEWLATNGLALLTEQQSLLQSYAKKNWWLIAARVAFSAQGVSQSPAPPAAERVSPANGQTKRELPPLIISFGSERCIYPLALSTVTEKPAELSLFVFAGEPLMSRVMFEKKYVEFLKQRQEWLRQRPQRERAWYASTNRSAQSAIQLPLSTGSPGPFDDFNDPRPSPEVLLALQTGPARIGPFSETDDDFYSGTQLGRCMKANGNDFPECTNALPRMAGKKWWLTKQTATLDPAELRELQIEAAVPPFAEKIRAPEGGALAQRLPQFGTYAVPVVVDCLNSTKPAERRAALSAMAELSDPGLVQFVPRFFDDPDPRTRAKACAAARLNWDSTFAPRLVELLSDEAPEVRSAACNCLQSHETESVNFVPAYQKMVEEGHVAAPLAMNLLRLHRVELPTRLLGPLLSSDERCTVQMAMFDLHDRVPALEEILPLLTNSSPMVRLNGVVLLLRRGDKEAMDRIVSLLHDPDEGLRWVLRQHLRRLSGQRLGADPAAWEKWWSKNRESFTPATPVRAPRR